MIDTTQFLNENLVTLDWLRSVQGWVFDDELGAWFSTVGDSPAFGSYFESMNSLRLGKEVFKLDCDPLTIGKFLAIQYGLSNVCRDHFGNIMDDAYFEQLRRDQIENERLDAAEDK